MKIAVISDVHQTVFWRKLIDQKDEYDKIVFLGDEFDSWENDWPHQMINAENIISFKNNCPEKIDLCWSNHAISYFLNERCSGYQSTRAADIKKFYNNYQDLYNPVYIYGNWIFSHAGLSIKWMRYCRIGELSEINYMFKKKPGLFRWIGPDSFGNNPNEGPLWIRPESLIKNKVPKFNQIAGHTENEEPLIINRFNQLFVFCDTCEHNFLTVINTENDAVEFVNLK